MNRGTRVTERARWSLVAVLLVVAGAGCGERVPTANELRPEGLRVGVVARPVASPVPYDAGRYRAAIGPEGGVLEFSVGSLTFPPGAVTEPTLITADVDGASIGVVFSPHGLRFPHRSRPVLRLDVGANAAGSVLYVDEVLRVLEMIPFRSARHGLSVEAHLAHFSKYIFGAS